MSAGQAVIRKGEQGDTFFILEEGTCTVVGDEGQVRACVCWAMPEHVLAYTQPCKAALRLTVVNAGRLAAGLSCTALCLVRLASACLLAASLGASCP